MSIVPSSEIRPRVLALGAYERDNFGDLLYVELMERHVRESLDVQFAAPIKADMTAEFGRTIPAAAPIAAGRDIDAVWTVGGEVVSASLEYAYRTAYGDDKFRELMALPRAARMERLQLATEGALYDSPYIVRPSTMRDPQTALILNSIGAAGISQMSGARREVMQATLREATFVSVRDRGSHEALTKLGVPHLLAPDLAHTLPSVHPIERATGESTYALVQLPEFAITEHGLDAWIAALASSDSLRNLPVRFFLAGLAPGHDRLETAYRACEALALATGWAVDVSSARGVWPRVEEIARAALWVGGSLHGRVVAASYGVPRVSLASWKVDQYAATWDAGFPFGASPKSLSRDVEAAYSHAGDDHSLELARQAEESIARAVDVVSDWRWSDMRRQQPSRLLINRVVEAEALRALALDCEDGMSAVRENRAELLHEIGRLREDRDRLRDEVNNLRADRDRWKAAHGACSEDRDRWKEESEG